MSPYSPFSYTSSLIVYLSSCSPFFFHISQCSPFPSQYILALLFSLLSHCSLNIISFYFLYFSYPLSIFVLLSLILSSFFPPLLFEFPEAYFNKLPNFYLLSISILTLHSLSSVGQTSIYNIAREEMGRDSYTPPVGLRRGAFELT